MNRAPESEILELKAKLAATRAKWRIASDRADESMELFKHHEMERAWALREIERIEDRLESMKPGLLGWRSWK